MRPLGEHETVIRVLREMVEQVILEASPVMATVTSVSASGGVTVRLDDAEQSQAATVGRNPAMRLRTGDRVLVIRTLSNQPVVVCPIAMSADATDAGRIGTEHLVAGAVTSAKLGPQAVDAAALAPLVVTAEKLATAAVTADKLAPLAVTAGKIAGSAVGNAQIAGGAVTDDKIASVHGGKIQGGTITADKIASGVIPPPPEAPDIPSQLPPTDNSVTTKKIVDKAVTTDKLDTAAVVGAKIKDESIPRGKLEKMNDGREFFAGKDHSHGSGEVRLTWDNVKDLTFKQTQNGNQTSLSLQQVLSRLYKNVYGGDSSVP